MFFELFLQILKYKINHSIFILSGLFFTEREGFELYEFSIPFGYFHRLADSKIYSKGFRTLPHET